MNVVAIRRFRLDLLDDAHNLPRRIGLKHPLAGGWVRYLERYGCQDGNLLTKSRRKVALIPLQRTAYCVSGGRRIRIPGPESGFWKCPYPDNG